MITQCYLDEPYGLLLLTDVYVVVGDRGYVVGPDVLPLALAPGPGGLG